LVTAALALVLVDLWSFGSKFVLTQPLQPNSAWWSLADRVMAQERAGYRVLEYGFNINPGTNDHILHHLQSLGGYDSLILRDAVALTEVNYGLEEKLLDMLAVRYILLNDKVTIDTQGYREVARDTGHGIVIYERKPQARAFVVHRLRVALHDEILANMIEPAFDPRREAIVESPSNCSLVENEVIEHVQLDSDDLDRVTFRTGTVTDGFLVVSDTFYPGWRAYVDGKSTPVVRVNYALQGICLPAGDHQVVFQFEPEALGVGAGLSVIGLVIVAVATVKRNEV
jgi:hypothetical protein